MKNKPAVFSLILLLSFCLITGCARQKADKPGSQFKALRLAVLKAKYTETIPKLEKFIKDHPQAKQASRAGLFLFKCHFALGDMGNARKWCDWTIEKFPGSLEAQKCKFKLVMIQLVEGKTEQAQKEFARLAKDSSVPQSPESKRLAEFLEEYSIQKKN